MEINGNKQKKNWNGMETNGKKQEMNGKICEKKW